VANRDEQAKEKKPAEEKRPTGTGKKRLIIIGGISILVLAIAISVFLYMRSRGGDEESAEAGVENKHEPGGATQVKAIYPFEPFIVNIYDGPNLRYLKVKLEFEIAGPEAKAEIDPFQAPMRDAILVLLSSKHMEEITVTEGKNKLRSEVMATIGKIVPPGKISRVYFTDFVVQ
jgi:flagellar protein FliL